MNRYCQSHAKATAAGLQCPPAADARVAYRVTYHIAMCFRSVGCLFGWLVGYSSHEAARAQRRSLRRFGNSSQACRPWLKASARCEETVPWNLLWLLIKCVLPAADLLVVQQRFSVSERSLPQWSARTKPSE